MGDIYIWSEEFPEYVQRMHQMNDPYIIACALDRAEAMTLDSTTPMWQNPAMLPKQPKGD